MVLATIYPFCSSFNYRARKVQLTCEKQLRDHDPVLPPLCSRKVAQLREGSSEVDTRGLHRHAYTVHEALISDVDLQMTIEVALASFSLVLRSEDKF